MSPEEIRLLYEYNGWANHRVSDAAAALTPEQFTQALGSSFPSVRDTLAHIYGAEWIWLERFQGRSPSALPKIRQFSNVQTLRETWLVLEDRLIAFVGRISQADINRQMEYKTLKYGVYSNPLWQSM